MLRKPNKKGNFADIPEYISTIMIFAIVLLFTGVFLFEYNARIQSMDNETIPEVAKNASANLEAAVVPKFDFLGAFITLFFIIVSVIAARLIPSSPKYIIIAIIAMIFLAFVAMIIENVWDPISSNAKVSAVADKMKFTTFILDNLTAVVVVYCILIGISMFTKTEETL